MWHLKLRKIKESAHLLFCIYSSPSNHLLCFCAGLWGCWSLSQLLWGEGTVLWTICQSITGFITGTLKAHLETSINLCMFLEKPECLKKTHACKNRRWKFHTERTQPLLCQLSANYYTPMEPWRKTKHSVKWYQTQKKQLLSLNC